MRIDGEWFPCEDGTLRPVVRGQIRNARQTWEPAFFLLDTGADCTVISAAILDVLGFGLIHTTRNLGGVGGAASSIEIATQIQFLADRGRSATFRGQYAAMTQLESLDISVLGRDILNMFAVIVDRPANVVALLRSPHRYFVETA